MPENSAYEFGAERVHILNCSVRKTARFTCRRCVRDLPESSFAPLYGFRLSASEVRRGVMKIALHPHCHICREQAKGKWTSHRLYSPDLDRKIRKLSRTMAAGARQRGIVVGVERDDLLALFLEQEGRCALTGIQMDWSAIGYTGRGGRALTAPSVDRIDSRGNYVLGNIQLVIQIVNIMKNDLPQDKFIKLCRLVAEHNLSNEVMTALAA